MLQNRPSARHSGYVLIAVLLVIVVLSLASYRFMDAMTSESIVAIRTTEAAQAKSFAVSGIHYAAGALSDPNTLYGTLGGNPGDGGSFFSGVAVGDSDPNMRGGGRFALVNVSDSGSGAGADRFSLRYGASDEGSKININALMRIDPSGEVLYAMLMKLPNMTEDVADAIVDWVDADDVARTNGAESDAYSNGAVTYRTKNGPLNSLDELLLVRGVTTSLLYGNDRNRNGRLDPGEEDGNDLNRGWSQYLTVYGREVNADSEGNARVWVSDTDLSTMYDGLLNAVGQEMADYIVAYRLFTISTVTTGTSSGTGSGSSSGSKNQPQTVAGTPEQLTAAVQLSLSTGLASSKRKLLSTFTLINTQVQLPATPGAPPNAPKIVVPCPLNDPEKLKTYLPLLLDKTCSLQGGESTPRINVNTAPQEVLMTLPGMTDQDAAAIIAGRTSRDPMDLATRTGSWLVTEGGIKAATFKSLEQFITGQSYVYKVQSLGYFAQGGPVARVEAVIDISMGTPRILYFRDLTDLGRGFEPPR